MDVPLIKGDRISEDTDYRDQLPVNMTAVKRNILGATGYMLIHPGLNLFTTAVGLDRGGYWNENQNIHFRVSGNKLVGIDEVGTVTELGDISGSKRASMVHSFNSQAVVADGRMWLYDGAFSEVTDPDLGDPIDITWIDNYYFLTDGEFIYHTEITNESAIDPLKFSTSEFSPDPTLAVDKTSDNQVVVFNRYSTEYFINRATDNFAFQRIEGKAIKAGVVGTHCETELMGKFYIMGGGREENVSVHVLSAGEYQSVATREVDKIIAEYTEIELADAVLETRIEDQDRYVLVRLPRHTLLFNETIAASLGKDYAWTLVKTDVEGDTIWRGVNGVYDPRVSKWLYGDNQNSNIGVLDNTIATHYGEQIESILFTPFIRMETGSIDEIEIDTMPGHQINEDDVTCAISLTYDGVFYGKEWFNLYGMKHNYETRFIARRLGYVREYVGFKLRCVSPERIGFTYLRLAGG